jgi:predicted nicotinamide N-methyase
MSGQAPLDNRDEGAVRAFIKDNTKWMTPPLVPEISLHLAEESLPIWQKTEEQLAEHNIAPPFWAFAWAGGQALARYLLDNRQCIAGKRVVDLGTGSGLTAIAAMVAGAQSVLASDIDLLSVVATRLNAETMGVAVDTTSDNLLIEPPGACDVLLIGDLFYERSVADAVLQYADRALAEGALVLCGDPKRNYFPSARFRSVARYQVEVTRELEDALIKNTSVWQLEPPCDGPIV